tara:strand:- start:12373 stop:13449 length:1077 start_codon:yes stop_codon:yes gene_type:complete
MQKEISSILTLSMTASIFTLSYTGLMLLLPSTSLIFIPSTILAAIIAGSAAITDGYIYGKNINQGITRFFDHANSLNEDGLFKLIIIGSLTAASISSGLAIASSAFEFLTIIYPTLIMTNSVFAGIFAMSAIASFSYFFNLYNIAYDLYQCDDNHIQKWFEKLKNPELSIDYLRFTALLTLSGLYSIFTFSAWQNKINDVKNMFPLFGSVFQSASIGCYSFWDSIASFGNAYAAIQDIDHNESNEKNITDIIKEIKPDASINDSNYEVFYKNTMKPIIFIIHTVGEACTMIAPGAFAFLSAAVAFTFKNLAEFNQFLGGHDDDHEHEHSDCAFGHSHDENPIDYILCTTPKKCLVFKI